MPPLRDDDPPPSVATLLEIAELGQPVLRDRTHSVEVPASPELRSLVDAMMRTMNQAQGVGIAAPQVFHSDRVFIVAPRPNARYPHAQAMEPVVALNPTIIERSVEQEVGWEGCLSIPGLRGRVPRSRRIVAQYHTLEGERVEREFTDFAARVFQHEDDHLWGIVFLDRIEHSRDLVTEREFRRIIATE